MSHSFQTYTTRFGRWLAERMSRQTWVDSRLILLECRVLLLQALKFQGLPLRLEAHVLFHLLRDDLTIPTLRQDVFVLAREL